LLKVALNQRRCGSAMAAGIREFSVKLPKDRCVLVHLGTSLELLDLLDLEGQRTPRLEDLQGFALNSKGRELKKAIERVGRGDVADLRSGLQKLLGHWKKMHRRSAVLEATEATRFGPRVFVDRVGSNTADLSWEVLEEVTEGFFEVALFGYSGNGLTQLGNFRVEGGSAARSFRLVRLQALRWYRVRVRSLAPQRRWISAWSNEVPFRTVSLADAKASGRVVNSSNFLVKSEQLLRLCVDDSQIGPEISTEMERMKVEFVRDLLGTVGSQSSETATNNLLDARYCQRGWPDFVKHGLRYARPKEQREERLRRMRLAIAAEELYGAYPSQNAWCQGPFYYEETGMKNMAKLENENV